SFYRQGEFIDLCRGPHIPHAGKIGAFKLLSIAGPYWEKNSNRKQLQPLYRTAFFSQKELDAYLEQVEEAKSATIGASGNRCGCLPSARRRAAGSSSGCRGGRWCAACWRPSSRRNCSNAVISRSIRRISAGWSCTGPAAISPTIATPSTRPCIST